MCLAIHTTNISQFAATFNDARNRESLQSFVILACRHFPVRKWQPSMVLGFSSEHRRTSVRRIWRLPLRPRSFASRRGSSAYALVRGCNDSGHNVRLSWDLLHLRRHIKDQPAMKTLMPSLRATLLDFCSPSTHKIDSVSSRRLARSAFTAACAVSHDLGDSTLSISRLVPVTPMGFVAGLQGFSLPRFDSQ